MMAANECMDQFTYPARVKETSSKPKTRANMKVSEMILLPVIINKFLMPLMRTSFLAKLREIKTIRRWKCRAQIDGSMR
jgi:hypothetical protein